jgi:hypothetical protein
LGGPGKAGVEGQLLDLVVDQLVVEVSVPDHGSWSDLLIGVAHDARRVLVMHRGLAGI